MRSATRTRWQNKSQRFALCESCCRHEQIKLRRTKASVCPNFGRPVSLSSPISPLVCSIKFVRIEGETARAQQNVTAGGGGGGGA